MLTSSSRAVGGDYFLAFSFWTCLVGLGFVSQTDTSLTSVLGGAPSESFLAGLFLVFLRWSLSLFGRVQVLLADSGVCRVSAICWVFLL